MIYTDIDPNCVREGLVAHSQMLSIWANDDSIHTIRKLCKDLENDTWTLRIHCLNSLNMTEFLDTGKVEIVYFSDIIETKLPNKLFASYLPLFEKRSWLVCVLDLAAYRHGPIWRSRFVEYFTLNQRLEIGIQARGFVKNDNKFTIYPFIMSRIRFDVQILDKILNNWSWNFIHDHLLPAVDGLVYLRLKSSIVETLHACAPYIVDDIPKDPKTCAQYLNSIRANTENYNGLLNAVPSSLYTSLENERLIYPKIVKNLFVCNNTVVEYFRH